MVCHFPVGILGQVRYLIVSIPDLCTLTYFDKTVFYTAIQIADYVYGKRIVLVMAVVYVSTSGAIWRSTSLNCPMKD